MMGGSEEAMRWGTWEELLLGGAVLRYGTRAWEAVASELRARTFYPYGFSPQECEAKYEDLQERFSGCGAWFEELRKQRVAELKRDLERSEDSIGSLQSKIESLMNEKEGGDGSFNCNAESTLPPGNADEAELECPDKGRSKDALSAGSFTEDTMRDWSPKTQVPVVDAAHENETKVEDCEESEKEKVSVRSSEIMRGNVKKKRGKRKRKGCNEVKEAASVGENDVFSSGNAVKVREESSTGACDRSVGPSFQGSAGSIRDEDSDLVGILDSIMEPGYTSPFRCRLESQKRARYKKTIRRHVDFGAIRSRIGNGTISSIKELFRDILLLCNNVLVFYPTRSPEFKSALSLRDSATKRFGQIPLPKDSVRPTATFNILLPPKRNPVKPRSIRPCNRKIAGKLIEDPGKVAGCMTMTISGGKESGGAEVPVESTVKKGVGRPAKGGRRGGRRAAENGGRGRKRAWRR